MVSSLLIENGLISYSIEFKPIIINQLNLPSIFINYKEYINDLSFDKFTLLLLQYQEYSFYNHKDGDNFIKNLRGIFTVSNALKFTIAEIIEQIPHLNIDKKYSKYIDPFIKYIKQITNYINLSKTIDQSIDPDFLLLEDNELQQLLFI
jgi:hypothetical protein